jgi:hypothetical protein
MCMVNLYTFETCVRSLCPRTITDSSSGHPPYPLDTALHKSKYDNEGRVPLWYQSTVRRLGVASYNHSRSSVTQGISKRG